MSFRQLAHTAIDALTTGILGQIFGQVFQLTKDTVKAVIDLVAKNIPDVDLPLNGAAFIKLIINVLKPFLPLLRIPLGPLPRTLGVPQLTLNLDSIVKPLLKGAIQILMDKLLSFFPFKVCDLPFTSISSNILNAIIRGIKAALKRAIMELISIILDPLQSIFKLLNLIKSVKGAFTSLFDMTNPFLKIYKMIKEMLERELPTAAFMKSINSLLLLAQLEALKLLDKASKNLPDIAVYLPIAAGSSLGIGPILRSAVHPLLNQDDLPTWDRLSMKNPLYVMFLDDLAHKAKAVGYHPKVILSGRDVNDQMSAFVSHKLIQLLAQNGKQIQGAKVLVLGVTFKENCPDFRNSKVFDIIGQLKKEGADVSAFDPYANAMEVFQKYQVSLITAFEQYDVILLAVAHDFFKALDYASLKTSPDAIVYDTKAFLDRSIVTARL